MWLRIHLPAIIFSAACLLLASSAAQAAKKKNPSVTRSYSVGQILGTMTAKPEKSDKEEKPGKPAEDKLIDLIVGTVQPDSWRQNGGRGRISYEPVSMTLVIHQAPAVHDEIGDLLAALERLLDVQVAIEIRLLSVSEACLERIGINFEPTGTSKDCEKTLETNRLGSETIETSDGLKTVLPMSVVETRPVSMQMGKAFLTDAQVREFLECAQGDRRSNLMQAPKLALLNGMAGVVEVADTQYFVTSLNLDYKNGQLIAKPTQEAFKFGVCLNVQPTVSADRKSILVSLKLKQTELVGPVPLIPVQIPVKMLDKNGKEKTKPELFTMFLQQPHVNTLAIENTSVIPDGQTLLLGGIKTLAEERNEFGPPIVSKIPYLNRLFKTVGYGRETTSLIIMVTPRIIVREEEEQISPTTSK